MSLYSAMIATAQSSGFLPLAWDFTQFNLATNTVPNLTEETGSNVFPGIASEGAITSLGLTQDGGQPFKNADDIGRAMPVGMIWIGRPSQATASSLFRHGYINNTNDFFEIALDSNLVPKAGNRYRGQFLTGSAPLSTTDPSVIVFTFSGDNGPVLLYGTLGSPLNRVEGSITRDSVTPDEFHYCDGFIGEVGLIIGLGSGYTEDDIQAILASFDAIGRVTLPTNLSPDRTQGIAAVEASGKIETSLFLGEGETEFSQFLTTKNGELIKFVAFDSTEGVDILATELVDPKTLTDIVFPIPDEGSSQSSKVSGVVQIDGTPAQRTVRAFGYKPDTHTIDGDTISLSKSLGHATSDPQTGEYSIDLLGGYDKRIFVVAFDDYGADFAPEQVMAVGDRIHPTTPNGYVFECTGAGTFPAEEPVWVVDTETSQLYGTASMLAKPFYRPMVHGPVAPEVTDGEAPQWTPADLFQNGELGAWYDPSDLSTLFQDTSALQPVTSDGQKVALILDKSGNGLHAIQTQTSMRPTYRTNGAVRWLEFDGSNHLDFTIPHALFETGISYCLAWDESGIKTTNLYYSRSGSVSPWAFVAESGNYGTNFSDVTKGATDTTICTLQVDGSGVSPLTRDSAYDALLGTHVAIWDLSGATGVYTATEGLGFGIYDSGSLSLSGKMYGLVFRPTAAIIEKSRINYWLGGKAGIQQVL